MRTRIKTNVNTFAISNHMASKLGKQALKIYLKITREILLCSLPNKKSVPQRFMVKTAKNETAPGPPSLA